MKTPAPSAAASSATPLEEGLDDWLEPRPLVECPSSKLLYIAHLHGKGVNDGRTVTGFCVEVRVGLAVQDRLVGQGVGRPADCEEEGW